MRDARPHNVRTQPQPIQQYKIGGKKANKTILPNPIHTISKCAHARRVFQQQRGRSYRPQRAMQSLVWCVLQHFQARAQWLSVCVCVFRAHREQHYSHLIYLAYREHAALILYTHTPSSRDDIPHDITRALNASSSRISKLF